MTVIAINVIRASGRVIPFERQFGCLNVHGPSRVNVFNVENTRSVRVRLRGVLLRVFIRSDRLPSSRLYLRRAKYVLVHIETGIPGSTRRYSPTGTPFRFFWGEFQTSFFFFPYV